MKSLFLALYMLALSTTAFGQSLEEEESAIRELWATFSEYYSARDAAGVASLYADDADRFEQVSKKAVGREEIRRQYERELARRAAEPSRPPFKPGEQTIRFLRPDVAILDGIAFPNESTQVHFTVILTKSEGRWWIAAGRPRGRATP